jgi:hypothetical protein
MGLVLSQSGSSKKKSSLFSKWVKVPHSIRGFTFDKLLAMKKKLGENKWARLKHLFLLNPHLPLLALGGHHITQDDVHHKPEWMKPNDDEPVEGIVSPCQSR